MNFPMDKIPPLCVKEIDCIDCDDYCEHISSNKDQLFIQSSDELGNRKIIKQIHAIPIKNGKTIAIDINDQEHELFILFEAGLITSNKIIIPAGDSDMSYFIQTTGGIIKKADIKIHCSG